MANPVDENDLPHGEEPPAASPSGFAGKVIFYVGSAGLLLATAADSIAVLGRHTGFALLGSIEIVQAAIVFIAASSMVSVTLVRGHAAVHILTDRLGAERRERLSRVAMILGTVALLLLATGSIILLLDVWDGHERSELLHIPLRWFRLLMIVALVSVAGLFARDAIVRRRHDA